MAVEIHVCSELRQIVSPFRCSEDAREELVEGAIARLARRWCPLLRSMGVSRMFSKHF